jgi:hypothetical protein
MTMLLDDPATVQVQSILVEGEPFHPGPADLAYDLAFTLARQGEPAQSPRSLDRAIRRAHFAGSRAGLAARCCDAARALGRTTGLLAGRDEAFPGYAAAEATAFAAGEAERAEDVEFEAWVASAEAERAERAFADPIADIDIYRRIGAVS